MSSFTLAIVGRPNVGKSTLFNRLVGRRVALVDDQPGITRDRRVGQATLGDLQFCIIDTPGFERGKSGSLKARMGTQTIAAIDKAHLVLLMSDARAGLLPEDAHFAQILRKANVPVILAGNKAEAGQLVGIGELHKLGFDTPIALSAEHGIGMDVLYGKIRDAMAAGKNHNTGAESIDYDARVEPEKPLRVAILGRPNAGKSSLINYLLREERLLTGPEAGLTRDSISVNWVWRDPSLPDGQRAVQLWDTAGVRRRARVVHKLEKLSVADSLRAVQFAEVVVLLIDAQSPFDKQDVQLADLVEREGRALVIGINKWDLPVARKAISANVKDTLLRALPQLHGVPVVMLSVHTGKGVEKLMPAIYRQYEVWNLRIGTGKLNRWLAQAIAHHPPPADKGRPVRLRYITQAKARPPTFVAFSSRGNSVPLSYLRYLANDLRKSFGLDGVPLRLFIRKGTNPYA